MAVGGSMQLSIELGKFMKYGNANPFKRQDLWSLQLSERIDRPINNVPCRYRVFTCRSFAMPSHGNEISVLRITALALSKSYNALHGSPLVLQLIPAVCVISFALWGLGPVMRHSRNLFVHRNDSNWKKSRTHYVFTSYLQPLLLWTGSTLICRALDPVVLPSEASQAVKQRLLNFVRSFSTVLAFAYCLSSLIQQTQKFFEETNDRNDTRNVGFQFAGKAVYTAVWIAAVALFMELLGFSTQKWITAGGLGTVLLTLAGREIFTNFLSSVMIHATRPFVVNEWIQTKIEGYEVSGTVEHVGWWSPTIIRGDDREAVHIPNHKFTVSVVRNLSQKSHWRIKTHLAISHLDVNKINNIVADMRKVLAKNPQVEQQRLHRRIFLDNINPENQALLILVSCFVKTSHFEEYLCVKEAILLDLLRVVSHHRARLATPIRTIQKVNGDADVENSPCAETIPTRPGATTSRPLLLTEPPSRVNGDEKTKARSTLRRNEEQTNKSVVKSDPDPKETGTVSEGSVQSRQQQKANSEDPHWVSEGYVQNYSNNKGRKKMENAGDIRLKNSKVDAMTPPSNPSSKSNLQGLNSKAAAVSEKDQANLSESENVDGTQVAAVHGKHGSERLPVTPPPPVSSRPCLEENIVLGVALGGSKRALPIEEGMRGSSSIPVDAKESAASKDGTPSPPSSSSFSSSSRDSKKDGQIPAVPRATTAEER